jgi:hypothetical protein
MWILPSRSRPHNIVRLIDAYRKTGATTPVWLRVDDDDPVVGGYYIDHPLWTMQIGEKKPLSELYAEVFFLYPEADWYGFIADDVVPETMQWDVKLIEAAGSDGMAVPAGGHEDYAGAPHFVLGGDLVRRVRWLALPGLDRLFIDTAWWDIAEKLGVLRKVPDVVLAHHHFSNKKAMYDKTYKKTRKVEDRACYDAWRKSGYNQIRR